MALVAPPRREASHSSGLAVYHSKTAVTSEMRAFARSVIASAPQPMASSFATISVELVLRIFEILDMRDAYHLAASNKDLKSIYDTHLHAIMLHILPRELSPFDDLLQAIVAEPEDLQRTLGPCLRRSVIHRGKIISAGEYVHSDEPREELLAPVTLEDCHFKRMLLLHRTVKGWEDLFVTHRFQNYTDRRSLKSHEAQRLRRALYAWLRYAHYFHGDLARPNPYSAYGQGRLNDIRCCFFRVRSDAEVREIQDLMSTVRSVLEQVICPSIETILEHMDGTMTRQEAARVGFGCAIKTVARAWAIPRDNMQEARATHHVVVNTFLKLTPAELLYYASRRASYPKERLIRDVMLAHPTICRDQASWCDAMDTVIQQRYILRAPKFIADSQSGELRVPEPFFGLLRQSAHGGILDIESYDDRLVRYGPDQDGERALSWPLSWWPETGTYPLSLRGMLDA